MPETTENYHRIPVSSGHDSHEIRTITVSSSQGIKALYCTDCKEIVTYLFDTDKWTMEEAKDWVEDHKEDSLHNGDSMEKKLNRRTKDVIGSLVRYKSYGSFQKSVDGDSDKSDSVYVRGFFTDDGVDEVGDIITKDATVDAVERWRKWGNIRTMHDYPSGRVHKIGENDGLDWNEVITVPVDEDTKKLIEGGVLKAYSVGIIPREYRINEELLQDMEKDGEEVDPWFLPLIIDKYDMIEISYVDHPANYSATIGDVSTGKSKEFEHKAVLFKNSELIGEADNMEKEREVAGAVEVEEEDVEPTEDAAEEEFEDAKSTEESEVEEVHDEVETAEDEADVEKEEGDEEEAIEKSEESEFDIALAVRDIDAKLDALGENFTGVADSLADAIVERLLEELRPEASEEVVDEAPEAEDDEEKSFNVDELVEKVIEGLAEILVPQVSRSASVSAGEEADDEPLDSAGKVEKYLRMPKAERLDAMKQILEERYNR